MATETQIFLQAMMTLKVCSEEHALALFSRARENLGKPVASAESFEDFLTTIQPKLVQFSLNLDKYTDPKSGEVYLALVNMISDKSAQLATSYSLLELDFFKYALDVIYYSNGFLATKQELATFTSNKSMTKRDADLQIDKLVDQKWLAVVSDKITFGIRTLVELGGYIKDLIGELPECHLCQGFATVHVERCINCDVDLHLHCKERLFENTAHKVCPGCKVEWDPVGSKKSRKRPARKQELEIDQQSQEEEVETQGDAKALIDYNDDDGDMDDNMEDEIPSRGSNRKRKMSKK